jgi:septal ring factor EnvC (AmiA/AmiB activator)
MAQRNLDGMSIDELQREIKRRERHLSTLERKRAKLMDQLAEVEQQIAEQGGALAASQGRKRPRNEQNLADALVDLLSDQTLNVTSIAEEVQRAGYRTSSPNFRTIVNQTLIKDKRFKRVGRGLYTAGSASGGGKKRTSKKKRTTKRTSRK